jgi:hypothetical protein
MDLGAAIRAEVETIVAREVSELAARLRAELSRSDDGERLLRKKVAADRAGVGVTTLDRWLAEGLLPAVSVPGRVPGHTERRIRQADLDDFIRRLAGNRRATDNTRSRGKQGSTTKQSTSGAPKSLDQLVQERLDRAVSPTRKTKTARQRA